LKIEDARRWATEIIEKVAKPNQKATEKLRAYVSLFLSFIFEFSLEERQSLSHSLYEAMRGLPDRPKELTLREAISAFAPSTSPEAADDVIGSR
jgi:hypothetical protein